MLSVIGTVLETNKYLLKLEYWSAFDYVGYYGAYMNTPVGEMVYFLLVQQNNNLVHDVWVERFFFIRGRKQRNYDAFKWWFRIILWLLISILHLRYALVVDIICFGTLLGTNYYIQRRSWKLLSSFVTNRRCCGTLSSSLSGSTCIP